MLDDDMPHPLSRVRSDPGKVTFFLPDGPAIARPGLALLAAQVISEWSLVDSHMTGVFVTMLGTNPGPGTAAYAELTAIAQQKAAMRAVAKLALDQGQDDILEAILTLYSSAAKQRHKIAHWVWGTAQTLPDKALLIDPAHLALHHVEFRKYEEAKNRGLDPNAEKPGIDPSDIFVYGERDFIQLSERIRRLYELVTDLRIVLSVAVNTAPAHDFSLLPEYMRRFEQLQNQPEIRPLIDRLRERRRKDQEAAQQSSQTDRPDEP